jgi:hypothetical protein
MNECNLVFAHRLLLGSTLLLPLHLLLGSCLKQGNIDDIVGISRLLPTEQ